MTKCRKSGEAFIFTVPDRSPLRNCTYLQRTAAQGSHGGPHGSEPTRGHTRRETEPAVLRHWEGPSPTAHIQAGLDLQVRPWRAQPGHVTLRGSLDTPHCMWLGTQCRTVAPMLGPHPHHKQSLCPQPRAMRAQAIGPSQCPQSYTGSGHRAITVPPTRRVRQESEGEGL